MSETIQEHVSRIEPDPVVEAVREDLRQRAEVGQKKHGVTLARTDLSLRDWLQHAYEETLDQANYLKRSIMSLDSDRDVLGNQVRDWIEGMQPSDLQNRSTSELMDEIERRRAVRMGREN